MIFAAPQLRITGGGNHRGVVGRQNRTRIIDRRVEACGLEALAQGAVAGDAAGQNDRLRLMTPHRFTDAGEQRTDDLVLKTRHQIDDDFTRRFAFRQRLDLLLADVAQHGGLQAAEAEVETHRIHARDREDQFSRPRVALLC